MASPRVQFRLWTLFVVVAVAVVAAAIARWEFLNPPPAYLTRDEVLEQCSGSDLIREPDVPGPYRVFDSSFGPPGPRDGLISAAGKTRVYDVPDTRGRSAMVVILVSQNGALTYLVVAKNTTK